jgi:fructokinase
MATGYCALDVICHNGHVSHRAGGTAANVAANLAYLGWDSDLVVRLGYDAPARRILRDIRQSGVKTRRVERSREVETPVVLYEVTPPRHRFLFSCPRCARKLPRHRPISNTHLEKELLDAEPPDVYFFDRAGASAIRLAKEMRARGALVVFEPSSPGVPARTSAAAETAHVIKCSHERRQLIDGALLAPRSRQLQIETLGAAGLRFRVGGRRWKELQAVKTTVVDSGGAGDWLTAALLTNLQSLIPDALKDVEDGLRRAQALAALSCRLVGARSLATQSRRTVERAVETLLVGEEPKLTRLHWERSSRAQHVCELCLGPR